jgi:hypothetical protein
MGVSENWEARRTWCVMGASRRSLLVAAIDDKGSEGSEEQEEGVHVGPDVVDVASLAKRYNNTENG